jgi:hypothetical protein
MMSAKFAWSRDGFMQKLFLLDLVNGRSAKAFHMSPRLLVKTVYNESVMLCQKSTDCLCLIKR